MYSTLPKIEGVTELTIQDNGRGVDVQAAFSDEGEIGGFGLSSMRERVESSGGFFNIDSKEGEGTRTRASWLS
jgi:two-component system NarL family sensor kinase